MDLFTLAHIPHTANQFLGCVTGLQELNFLTSFTHLHCSFLSLAMARFLVISSEPTRCGCGHLHCSHHMGMASPSLKKIHCDASISLFLSPRLFCLITTMTR